MTPMHEFFAQSGYPMLFAALHYCLRSAWCAGHADSCSVPAALAWRASICFGAVLTHIHNGDPLNDSTVAISMLLRLGVFSVLWEAGP